MKHFYLIIAFLLTGCTVGPTYQQPSEKLPLQFSLTKKINSKQIISAQPKHWYSAFNDAVLSDLIQRALKGNNLDIQKSLASIRESRAELSIARADFLPQLDVDGHIHRDRLSANSEILSAFPTGIIPLSYTDYKLGFDASWELDLFGHTRRSVEAAHARFQTKVENQLNVSLAVAAEVAKVYTEYRVYQKRINLIQHTINSYNETVNLVTLQMKAGSATAVDLERSESQLLNAKAVLPPLQAEAKASLAALAVLVGEYPEILFIQLDKNAPIPVVRHPFLVVGLPSDLLQHRPDIKIAERQLAAATADIGVAVANQFPRFQLLGDLGSDTTIPGTYWQKASTFWSLGPQVSIPLFQGGRLKNAVKSKEAARDAALAAYRQTVLHALADVESSLIRYHHEALKSQKLLASYHKLKSSAQLIKLQYQSGQTSLMDVLDVERRLDATYDQYAQSLGQTSVNLVALHKALGGDWV